MRSAAAIVAIFVLSATARAESGVPNSKVLAEMGLGGLRIMSDTEALVIRGAGVPDLAGLESFRQHIADFHGNVADFQNRLANRTSKSADRFVKLRTNFSQHVDAFRNKIH